MKTFFLRLVLVLIAPYGFLIYFNAALNGWENGALWWQLWRDLWFDRPASVCFNFEE